MSDFEILKIYVDNEIEWLTKPSHDYTKEDVTKCLERSFGAVMFYLTCHAGDYEKVDKWWNPKRDEFWELREKAPTKKGWKKNG